MEVARELFNCIFHTPRLARSVATTVMVHVPKVLAKSDRNFASDDSHRQRLTSHINREESTSHITARRVQRQLQLAQLVYKRPAKQRGYAVLPSGVKGLTTLQVEGCPQSWLSETNPGWSKLPSSFVASCPAVEAFFLHV
jgi:hypothetical protein